MSTILIMPCSHFSLGSVSLTILLDPKNYVFTQLGPVPSECLYASQEFPSEIRDETRAGH